MDGDFARTSSKSARRQPHFEGVGHPGFNKMYNEEEDKLDPLERRWKSFEERQKAKVSARMRQMNLARPTSAEGAHKDRNGRAPEMRPRSAKNPVETRMALEECEDSVENRLSLVAAIVTKNKCQTQSRLDKLEEEAPEDLIPASQETVRAQSSEEELDVLIADNDHVVTKNELDKSGSMDEAFLCKAPLEEVEGQNHQTSQEDSESKDVRAEGPLYTPLTVYDSSEEDLIEDIVEPSVTCADEVSVNECAAEAPVAAMSFVGDQKNPDDAEADAKVEEFLERMMTKIKDLISNPVPMQLPRALHCCVRRQGGNHFELIVERNGSPNLTLMTAKKRKATTTTYAIYDAKDAEREIALVKANMIGTNFTVSTRKESKPSRGIENEVAVVTYEQNMFGFKGPRRIGVVVPGMTLEGERVVLKRKDSHDSIVSRLKNNATANLIKMENKSPQWNEESGSYVLNFQGRVTKPSIKNFQIVHETNINYIVLQFGRIDDHDFTLDFRHPLCPLQAFGVALSCFDRKLACE